MFRYPGGKARIAGWVVSHFPTGYENMTYCEPCVGGGWVWGAKNPSKREILSDINPSVYNVWKSLRDTKEREEILWALRWLPHGRALFDSIRHLGVESACDYLVLQSLSFGGKGGPAGFAAHKSGRHHLAALADRVSRLSDRLNTITVRHQPYDAAFASLDTPDTFFYIDPPYVDTEYYYKQEGFRHDWLAYHLQSHITGKWLLSYEYHPLLDVLYPVTRFPRTYRTVTRQTDNATGGERKVVEEILIRNY